jgi:hypothetical protein
VQQEALRTRLSRASAWGDVEKSARAVLNLKPDDPRALYVLARHDFEQPPANRALSNDPRSADARLRPPDKGSPERVRACLERVARLKKVDNYPVWRTLYLEAQARRWLREDARGKAADRAGEQEALLAVLREARDEAPRLPALPEGFTRLSAFDIEGAFELQLMALEEALSDGGKPDTRPERAVAALGELLDFCRKTLETKPAAAVCTAAVRAALVGTQAAEPAVGAEPPAAWAGHLKAVQDLAREALARKAIQEPLSAPKVCADLAEVLTRQAALEGKRARPERKEELEKQAREWVELGLKLGKEARASAAVLAPLNTQAALTLLLRGAKRDEVAPYLAALREVGKERDREKDRDRREQLAKAAAEADARAAFIDGVLAEREGRLESARRLLEQATAGADAARAHLLLGGLYLALNQPEKAVGSLQAVEKAYRQFDRLPPVERAWAEALHSARKRSPCSRCGRSWARPRRRCSASSSRSPT